MSRLISFLSSQKITDVSCGFRAYSREALLNLNLFGKFTYTQESILDLSYKELRLKEIPIKVTYFPERRSRVASNILNYAWNTSKIILRTARDYKPLKFFGFIGIGLFCVGIALDLSLIYHFLNTGSFSPYKILGFAGAFLNATGLTIVAMAMIADMLNRMRINQERILYHEKRKTFQ